MAPNKKSKTSKRKSNKTLFLAIGILAIILIGIGAYVMLGQSGHPAGVTPTPTPTLTNNLPISPTSTQDPAYVGATEVLLHTSKGDITIALRNDMPITTGNFINLVRQGTYNGTIFHRVIAGFMIQGGDPTGTGYGDPLIPNIQDEFTSTNHNFNGTIAMANTGQPNSGSSQFFINVADNGNNPIDQQGTKFDTAYPAFGKVISGMDVVMNISNVPTSSSDKPYTNVTIIGASIVS
jgi:Peptidyl-prolyl cis-trans isomerase (rotamase) - cyclophilin family